MSSCVDSIPQIPGAAHQGQAVVIGASLAGLIAVRVLCNHFECVTLIERDELPEQSGTSKGCPAGQAEIRAALAKKPNAIVYSYPGQWHAFTRLNGAHYNAAAASAACRRARILPAA